MKFIETPLVDAYIIEPNVLGDERGYFMECYKKELFDRTLGTIDFIQDNESRSRYGVLRGLHYQRGDLSQAKLVRALSGSVLDVIVDLRGNSPSFGKHFAVELSEENKRQLFVPRGFAHGFAVLSPTATFSYKVDNVYAPQAEECIRYDDPMLGIDWQIPTAALLLSEKDKVGKKFSQATYF